ncbi:MULTISPECIES: YihY/virulence factor BrkB family protein [unclassified Okeania]|uniref:YihY/virulence factor BrkB family protein n=1 Tax=unclassified Okeania TaxID=2634635 RepID=UPI0013B7E43F|nr:MULTISPECIES: YihY/virulence factor BrkB family protein [unclassified Okeania]NES78657.1 YihY/virulence factor BrkB family protein [Okeania sp. SIO1H4]NET14641.1 YihY/virulence factor BrkB family protein [Okeania sp. SIO1H6]NET22147.1 YihY/virulence factor BrkB family protein [Okeania sp. SIO1H5]NET95505.1 YihY/virulence factor BrkB family protein [Okeania sp. SIO1H2]
MNYKIIFRLLKKTFQGWQKDKAPILAAALTYHTLFSIAPLFIIAVAIAGFVFGKSAAEGELVTQLENFMGQQIAETIEQLVINISRPQSGIVATLIGFATLFWGASNLFAQLKLALNMIWNVSPPPNRGIVGFIQDRLLSVGMVLGAGLVLILLLVASAVLTAINQWLNKILNTPDGIWSLIDVSISFGIVMLLFAGIYKFLPDVKIAWSDVWIGSAITAVLFTVGKSLIGLYLGNSGAGSAYGVAGSLVVLLLWINYSWQILFFGAEFTQIWANKYGSRIVAKSKEKLHR